MFDDYYLARCICAFSVGGLISLNGSYAQVLTQNPLAAPSTLGIQALSLLIYLFGYGVSFVFKDADSTVLSLILFHFVFIALCIFYKKPQPGLMKRLILFGICLNLFVGSLYAFLQFTLLNMGIQFPSELWFGNFRYATSELALGLFFLLVFCAIFSYRKGRKLRVVVFGSEYVDSYFRGAEKLEKNIFLLMVYSTCLVTLYFGYFSFLGLLLPHFLRSFRFFQKDILNELFGCILFGGLFFAFFDSLCYFVLIRGAELPVGMITAVIGPLILLVVLFYRRREIKNIY